MIQTKSYTSQLWILKNIQRRYLRSHGLIYCRLWTCCILVYETLLGLGKTPLIKNITCRPGKPLSKPILLTLRWGTKRGQPNTSYRALGKFIFSIRTHQISKLRADSSLNLNWFRIFQVTLLHLGILSKSPEQIQTQTVAGKFSTLAVSAGLYSVQIRPKYGINAYLWN